MDSTWFDYTRPLVEALPGVVVEVNCRIPREEARRRYRARAAGRHAGHLDLERRNPRGLSRLPARGAGGRF